jgi:regulator of protease activity HflC (stomatin/prohibitin superfamily)
MGVIAVGQGQAVVVERRGQFHGVLGPGTHVLVPFLDKVRGRVDLRPQVASYPPLSMITADGLEAMVDLVVGFQVIDPRQAVYQSSEPGLAVEQLAVTGLRRLVGDLTMERLNAERRSLDGELGEVLGRTTGAFGVQTNFVQVKRVQPAR